MLRLAAEIFLSSTASLPVIAEPGLDEVHCLFDCAIQQLSCFGLSIRRISRSVRRSMTSGRGANCRTHGLLGIVLWPLGDGWSRKESSLRDFSHCLEMQLSCRLRA